MTSTTFSAELQLSVNFRLSFLYPLLAWINLVCTLIEIIAKFIKNTSVNNRVKSKLRYCIRYFKLLEIEALHNSVFALKCVFTCYTKCSLWKYSASMPADKTIDKNCFWLVVRITGKSITCLAIHKGLL